MEENTLETTVGGVDKLTTKDFVALAVLVTVFAAGLTVVWRVCYAFGKGLANKFFRMKDHFQEK